MKILVCPLNWGLGHATRCVPIVRQLLAESHEPVIVSDGYPLEFLKLEFPSLRFIEYPSYPVYYASGKSQVGAMLTNLPDIIKGIINEHLWLKNLLQTEHFDRVISDNRFGMWNKQVHSIYITHQIMVKMPYNLKFLEPLIQHLHKGFINRYDECWIPDRNEMGGLSGDLAHQYSIPRIAKFIGILSRFQGMTGIEPDSTYETVAIVSGPEPQRTIFENQLVEQYRNSATKTLIICGKPQKTKQEQHIGNITLLSHLYDNELVAVLVGSTKIVCRSGYSTIMDLETLNCLHKAEFIPTPGQTEQEYLKSFHNK